MAASDSAKPTEVGATEEEPPIGTPKKRARRELVTPTNVKAWKRHRCQLDQVDAEDRGHKQHEMVEASSSQTSQKHLSGEATSAEQLGLQDATLQAVILSDREEESDAGSVSGVASTDVAKLSDLDDVENIGADSNNDGFDVDHADCFNNTCVLTRARSMQSASESLPLRQSSGSEERDVSQDFVFELSSGERVLVQCDLNGSTMCLRKVCSMKNGEGLSEEQISEATEFWEELCSVH